MAESISGAVARREHAPVALLSDYRDRFAAVLPDHVPARAFVGLASGALYRDPELLGHYYAAPYAIHEPDLCLVLTHNAAPCGYILGTRDSAAFAEWMDTAWLPVLRTRYPLPAPGDMSPDAEMIRRFHARPARHPGLPGGWR